MTGIPSATHPEMTKGIYMTMNKSVRRVILLASLTAGMSTATW